MGTNKRTTVLAMIVLVGLAYCVKGCCDVKAWFTATVDTRPTEEMGDVSICLGESAYLWWSGSGDIKRVTITPPPDKGQVTIADKHKPLRVTPSKTTEYTLTITGTEGCVATGKVTVYVYRDGDLLPLRVPPKPSDKSWEKKIASNKCSERLHAVAVKSLCGAKCFMHAPEKADFRYYLRCGTTKCNGLWQITKMSLNASPGFADSFPERTELPKAWPLVGTWILQIPEEDLHYYDPKSYAYLEFTLKCLPQ